MRKQHRAFVIKLFNLIIVSNENDLSVVVSSDIVKKGLVAFSQVIMSFFSEKKEHNIVIFFAKMALYCAPTNSISEDLQLLKRMIFNQSLELKDFDEAYTALITISEPERWTKSF